MENREQEPKCEITLLPTVLFTSRRTNEAAKISRVSFFLLESLHPSMFSRSSPFEVDSPPCGRCHKVLYVKRGLEVVLKSREHLPRHEYEGVVRPMSDLFREERSM